MNSIIERIAIFVSNENENVVKYNSLVKEFKTNEEDLKLLSFEKAEIDNLKSSLNNESYDEFSKNKIETSLKSRESSFLRKLAILKKERQSILKSQTLLLSKGGILEKIQEIEEKENFDKINKAVRSGGLPMSVLERISKAKKGVVQYADNIVLFEGDILLLKRSKIEETQPDKWTIPGGHVDLGEDFRKAAIREFEEEAGVLKPDLKVCNYTEDFLEVGEYKNEEVHIKYFQTILSELPQIILQGEEMIDCEWVSMKDLFKEDSEYDLPFNMKENLQKILKWNEEENKEIIKARGQETANKIAKVMQEFKDGTLKTKDGVVVTERKQAIAIALSEAGMNKDIEKAGGKGLIKKKRLVVKNGKTFFQYFWVKDGEEVKEETDESKTTEGEDPLVKKFGTLETGMELSLSTGKKDLEGQLFGFSIHKNGDKFLSIKTSEGLDYVKTTSVKKFEIKKGDLSEYSIDGKYKKIKDLGGSTGAILVEDSSGNKFVRKTGKDKAHIKAEHDALILYRSLEVDVPIIKSFDEENGILLTEYIPDLKKIEGEVDNKQTQKDFIIDALLANWDVIGLDNDNTFKSYDSFSTSYYRIDVGGSLNKRAQGEDKEFGEEVKELETMRDPSINPSAAAVFKGLTESQIISQINSLPKELNKWEVGAVSNEIKDAVNKRIGWLKAWAEEKHALEYEDEAEKINFKGSIYDISEEYFGKNIADFYKSVNKDMKVTALDLSELVKLDKGFISEEKAIEIVREKKNGSVDEYEKFIEAVKSTGITNREMLAINQYTGGSYGSFNSVIKNYTNSKTGNINFSKNKVGQKIGSSKASNITLDLTSFHENQVAAAKTINYHHEKGDTDYSMEKLNKAKEDYDKLIGVLEDMTKSSISSGGEGKYTTDQIEVVSSLVNNFKSIQTVAEKLDVSKKVKTIDPHPKLSSITSKTEVKTEEGEHIYKNELDKLTQEYGKEYLIKTKLLVNGLRKLESSNNPLVKKYGSFNRGIKLYADEKDKVLDEHSKENDFITHQWASSSSYNSTGFTENVRFKIHGKGANIKSISRHSGENEVLHKPFTLYSVGQTEKISEGTHLINLNKIE